MVELTSAVVGDVNPVDAVIERDLRILGGGDALERQRNVELALDQLDGAPVKRGLVLAPRHVASSAGLMALGQGALAPAVMRGIDGQAECRVAIGYGARHMILDERVIAAHIELEDAQGGGSRFRHALEPGLGYRAQHMGDAELLCRMSNAGSCALVE